MKYKYQTSNSDSIYIHCVFALVEKSVKNVRMSFERVCEILFKKSLICFNLLMAFQIFAWRSVYLCKF